MVAYKPDTASWLLTLGGTMKHSQPPTPAPLVCLTQSKAADHWEKLSLTVPSSHRP